ncbi:hypothetical protein [Thermococcus sp.]|uniref:hypothetical protein n=1 Tax=Thermococcus sp. TaxID=35749 RepID=UPI00261B1680|nr:hypothetical protein [Thermococcus sp.]
MLSYLLFAILAGLAKGIALLILGLTGALISLLKPSTLRKKAVALIFVLSLLSLRIVYVFDDITLLHLLLALLAPIIYVTAGVESVETTRTFAVGLFVFTLVSTVSSGSGILTIAILAPTLLGLLVLYGVERMIRRDTECTKNWLD